MIYPKSVNRLCLPAMHANKPKLTNARSTEKWRMQLLLGRSCIPTSRVHSRLPATIFGSPSHSSTHSLGTYGLSIPPPKQYPTIFPLSTVSSVRLPVEQELSESTATTGRSTSPCTKSTPTFSSLPYLRIPLSTTHSPNASIALSKNQHVR